ncbi:sulfatase-like hydrolase/transferase [Seonamhaeicola sp. MEBiC1930]|uniref:sulfatase-like hydrolase/transferase n=1 Tax=Seonamhaeicola sp. MEBiC01930 TaxID=2976768 RepID=UPI003253C522
MRNLIKIVLLSLGSISSISCSSKFQSKISNHPNIIILLADDMGYGELGTYGQEIIQTPFLDSLANQSMRFTDFYAGTSVCGPSRASLMTGKHTGHTNIRGNHGMIGDKWRRIAMKKEEVTLGEMMKGAGYQTAFIGKWHLGLPDNLDTWAMSRGFDYTVQEQWGEDEQGRELDERMHWINNRQDSAFYDYKKYDCIDEFRTNFALNYFDEKESDKPFFLFMSYRIPHAHEFYLRDTIMYSDRGWPEIERRHAARITMFDKQIKRLVDYLKEKNELENTLIIFTSDNGPHSENSHDKDFFKSGGNLKGLKRDLYEGGIRVPMFAYWRNRIKGGTLSKLPSAFYDIMPTLAEISGVNVPEQTDGISILPTLVGEDEKQENHDFLYWEFHRADEKKSFKQGARIGKWKGVRYGDNYHTEIYDLDIDIEENHDLSELYPQIVIEMNKVFKSESTKNVYYPWSGGIFKN